MSQLSALLRDIEGGGLGFWCAGCKGVHVVYVGEGPGPRWGWNQDVDKPTFTPSVHVRYEDCDDAGNPNGRHVTVCHTFVTNGRIQYLDDCRHALRGWHDMAPWPARPE